MTASITHADAKRAIDAYFEGRSNGASFARIEQHLVDCEGCRRHFERRQLLAELDPKGTTARERIGRNLGFDVAKPAAQARIFSLAGLASALTAAIVLVVAWPGDRDAPPGDGFTARGGPTAHETAELVEVFRITPAGPRLAKGSVSRDDELAFAYRNPTARERLMIYGVDETGAVYWYHPAWTDPSENPTADHVQAGSDVKELKEAIAHSLAGHRLRVYALYTDAPLTVREVEARLAQQQGYPEAVLVGDFDVVP